MYTHALCRTNKMKKDNKMVTILPYSPVVPLFHKQPDSIWL